MKRNRGFTLLELSGVILIIGVLAAILLPALARGREQARCASCLNNLSQIGLALHAYAEEHGGQLPWSGGHNNAQCLEEFAATCLPGRMYFICPSDSQGGKQDLEEAPINTELNGLGSYRQSYDYLGAYTFEPIVIPPPEAPISRIPVMWDLRMRDFNHHSGSNILLLDGSVEFLRTKEFNAPYAPIKPPIGYDEETLAAAYKKASDEFGLQDIPRSAPPKPAAPVAKETAPKTKTEPFSMPSGRRKTERSPAVPATKHQ